MLDSFRRTLLVTVFLTGCAGSALAQESRQDYEIRKAREKQSDELGKANMAGPQPDAPTAARNAAERQREFLRDYRLEQLRVTFKEFQAARDQLLQALTSKSKLKDPARRIDKATQTFMSLLPKPSTKPSFDAASLKSFTQTELGWETLTTAERLTPDLVIYIASESAQVTDLQYLKSLPNLHAELLRLRRMAQQLR
jgi:ribosomal protein S11